MTSSLSLSQLLPYTPETKTKGSLEPALKEYRSLLTANLAANKSLLEGNIPDPLVGENACEIRGEKLAKTHTKLLSMIQALNEKINQSIIETDKLLAPREIRKLCTDKTKTLKTLLEQLDVPLEEEQKFFLQSYLLDELKDTETEEKRTDIRFAKQSANYRKYLKFGDVSPSFADRLLEELRVSTAKSSVQYIQKQAETLNDSSLIKMITNQYQKKHNKLACIPMFWTYKTILLTAQKEGIPLLIFTKFFEKKKDDLYETTGEETLLFKGDANTPFHEIAIDSINSQQACVVIEGVAVSEEGQAISKEDWKKKISQWSVTDVILAGGADHRQYPKEEWDKEFEGNSEYEAYKSLAKREGFSGENPSLFFMNHVYAAGLSKFLPCNKETPAQPAKRALGESHG